MNTWPDGTFKTQRNAFNWRGESTVIDKSMRASVTEGIKKHKPAQLAIRGVSRKADELIYAYAEKAKRHGGAYSKAAPKC